MNTPKINYQDLETIKCDKCDSELFTSVNILKKISALYSGTGKDELLAIPVFECNECGHINEDLLKYSMGE